LALALAFAVSWKSLYWMALVLFGVFHDLVSPSTLTLT